MRLRTLLLALLIGPQLQFAVLTTAEAQQAGRVYRIVMVISADAVGNGRVASLAGPGANVTGITSPYPRWR
jgi:hypothetical protein